MRLDKLNPTGYDAYVWRKYETDRRLAKKAKGERRDAKRKAGK